MGQLTPLLPPGERREQTVAAGYDGCDRRAVCGGGTTEAFSHTLELRLRLVLHAGGFGTEGAWSGRKKKRRQTQGDQRGAGLASEQDGFQWEAGSLAETPSRAGSGGVGVWGCAFWWPPGSGQEV